MEDQKTLFDETTVITPEDAEAEAKDIQEQEKALSGDVMNRTGLQRLHSEHSIAVQTIKPRFLDKVHNRIKSEVERSPLSMFYKWNIDTKSGSRPIQGASISLALAVARNYGNCTIDCRVEETTTHFLFTAAFLDHETMFTLTRSYRQRKAQNIGAKYDDERKEDISFQIGQSKAIRNVILNSVPDYMVKDLTDHAIKYANSQMTPEQINELKDNCIIYFTTTLNIEIERLCNWFGEKDPMKWSREKIIELGANGKAIQSGELDLWKVFPPIQATPDESDKKTTSKKKEKS